MTKPVTIRTLLASIRRGEFDDQLDSLNKAVTQRLETVHQDAIQPGGLARIEGMPESSAAAKYNGFAFNVESVTAKTVNGTLVENSRRVSIPAQYVVPHLSTAAERRKRDAAVKGEVRKALTKKRVIRRKTGVKK